MTSNRETAPIAASPAPCAFGDAVEPHRERMFRAARRVLPSDDLAWDAVQITLMRLWRADGVPEHACGILMKVVRVVSLEVLRGERRRAAHEGAAAALARDVTESEPSERLADEELGDALRAAVEELPLACRHATELRFQQDLDYRQLAAELGVPIGTVRSRLHRARRLLAEKLSPVAAG